ncbi:hypothetical protein GUJ93_ZPchr0012g21394 [Zizania palustris]|uniref:Uncharacterized protein n=1 Tax=Zizania palustris TaxID=103762 RepID=A0A8J6BND2_ZIZPA|nr:hypothetical protein GUJ93_ZPchr0012g21394 [Zizania palustris]
MAPNTRSGHGEGRGTRHGARQGTRLRHGGKVHGVAWLQHGRAGVAEPVRHELARRRHMKEAREAAWCESTSSFLGISCGCVWEEKRISSPPPIASDRDRLFSYRCLALASADSLAGPLAAVHGASSAGASPSIAIPSRSLPLRSSALFTAYADSLAWPLAVVQGACFAGASPPVTPSYRSLPFRSPPYVEGSGCGGESLIQICTHLHRSGFLCFVQLLVAAAATAYRYHGHCARRVIFVAYQYQCQAAASF